VLSILLLLTIIIILLSINIQKRKKVELKLQESEKNLEITVERRTQELKSTIESLQKAQEQLVYSEKMSALGGLVAGVSHEINTPIGLGLTGITHFLDITKKIIKDYKKENLSQEEFEQYLEDAEVLANVIFTNLNRSAELVRSFKQISVDQTSEAKRSFNLKDYTQEILLSLTNLTKKRDIKFDLQCDDINIDSYPGAYSQIITNLIANALNHAFGKKDIGEVFIGVKQIKDKVSIVFKDNGKGISEENIDKIFNPFFTTNREFGGTGLGLNIVYNIVKTTFNGSITCTSTPQIGTQFDIELTI
jgi:signal transduction histidine kinase